LKDPGAVVGLAKVVDILVVGYIAAVHHMRNSVHMLAAFDQQRKAVGRKERDRR
jgi:F0F1-type ATP synthase assembly protein I